MKFEKLLDLWRDRRSQKTTLLGIVLAILSLFGVPSSEPELAQLLLSFIDLPEGYAGAATDVSVGLIGLAFVFLDGKKFSFGPRNGQVNSPSFAFVLALALILLLPACGPNASLFGGYLLDLKDPQNQAGLVRVHYQFCENDIGGYEICNANMVDGKEQAKVDLAWSIDQDGKLTIDYSATDSRAFQAFTTRADLQKALGESLGATVFDAMQSIINPASGAASLVPNPD